MISESVNISFDKVTAMPFVFHILLALLWVYGRKQGVIIVEIFEQFF